MSIFSANVRSLLRNGVELSYLLEKHSPDILLLQKTWLDSSVEYFRIEYYRCVTGVNRRDGRHGGGICAYARSHINSFVHVADSAEAEHS